MKEIKFLNCRIDLSKKVFSPRVETEYWVEKAIREIKGKNLKILDVFAGSGCVGIAILRNLKDSRVDFADIDENALAEIRINAEKNEIPAGQYRIVKSDLFENLKGKKYDVIFANPPYVAERRMEEVDKDVLENDPGIALFSGKEGLNHIDKLLKKAKNHLTNGGLIYFEFDPKQKETIKDILEKEGYDNFQFRKDQFKKYRWIKIVK
ncbi:MAG: HemK family protein methyltransferase [Candidatus Pacebacteria bacterium]|nr:HemK family protein methyltransferase [Candidatus Paceibacterota bacterium]